MTTHRVFLFQEFPVFISVTDLDYVLSHKL